MWTFPVPIPSRIPSTPWKTDTRTAGPGLPSSFSFMSAQRRPHNSGAVRHLQQEHPPGCSFFCPHRPTPAARMRRPRTGRARLKREDTRTRAANAPLCPPHRAGPAPPNAVAATAARKIPCPVPLPQHPCPVLLFPAPAAAAARFRPARPASLFRLEAAVPPC